jgi:hypothetical protein
VDKHGATPLLSRVKYIIILSEGIGGYVFYHGKDLFKSIRKENQFEKLID